MRALSVTLASGRVPLCGIYSDYYPVVFSCLI